VLALGLALASVAIVGLIVARARLHRRLRLAQSESNGFQRTAALHELKARNFDELTAKLAETIEAKDRYFAHIHQATQEKNNWCRIYDDARRQYGPALELMLTEIDRLSRLAKTPVRPLFARMVEGFRQTHPPPDERPRTADGLPALPEAFPVKLGPGSTDLDVAPIARVA